MSYLFVGGIGPRQTNVETYKYLMKWFSSDEGWRVIQPSPSEYWKKTSENEMAIDFRNSSKSLSLDRGMLSRIRDKQLYLVLYCWMKLGKYKDIPMVLFCIKEAILDWYKDEHRYLQDDSAWQDKIEIRYKDLNELFQMILDRLPSEIVLAYQILYS